MNWVLSFLLKALLAAALGALLGDVAGSLLATGHPAGTGAFVGAAIGALLAALVDALRGGRRLLSWLRGPQTGSAPRDAGFWGEMGYRVERAIRLRERDTVQSELRLAQFRSAIEASPNGVMILDAGDHIEWCNSVAADHFALDPQRDRQQRVTNLLRSPAFVAYLQGAVWDDAVRVPSPDGRGTLSVLIRAYGAGQKLVLSQDVTDRERTEAMRRDFVANVSHEIRTPLTVVAGAIETLQTLSLDAVERARVLQLLTQQTQRMQSLVADLLTLAVLEGSPRPPAGVWLSGERLMRRVEADALALSAGRHRLAFGGEASLQIAGAESELLSAIGNLVANAVRYTPPGGTIGVAWRRADDGSAEVAVADSGIGIDREHLPRLAERFYRVDGSRSRDTGGTGLGLSIVKHVMQRHGGELEVASERGLGSTFRLVFPAARVRGDAAAAAGEQLPLAAAVDAG